MVNKFEPSFVSRLDNLTIALDQQHAKLSESRKNFLSQFKDTKDFAEGRIVDLTDVIRFGDPTNPVAVVQSFNQMNEKLFPVDSERETPEGLKAYVQPDNTRRFPANERRILAVWNEDKTKIIAAAIYGIAATPNNLRNKTGVDGVLGLTYVMVDQEYRGSGIGRYLATQIVPEKAREFLRNQGGVANPRLISGGEVNEVRKMTLDEALSDMEGTLTLPNARQNFWKNSGLFPLEFDDYSQIKLRPENSPYQALRLFISGWDKDTIPSDLVWFFVKSHSMLCLSKQRELDQEDNTILRTIKASLLKTPTINIIRSADDHVRQDAELLKAMRRASLETPVPRERLMKDILDGIEPGHPAMGARPVVGPYTPR